MTVAVSFPQYLATLKAHDNPRGDFIRDLRRCGKCPDFQSEDEIRWYLMRRNGWLTAGRSAIRLWREYQRCYGDGTAKRTVNLRDLPEF